MKDCRFWDGDGCTRALCFYPLGGPLCDPPEVETPRRPKAASGKVSILVDSFDYYCITTLCPVMIFTDHRADGKCPLCTQLGEIIGGTDVPQTD